MTTATNETPVERRLRKLMQRADADNQGETADAIDAAREAIALWRAYLAPRTVATKWAVRRDIKARVVDLSASPRLAAAPSTRSRPAATSGPSLRTRCPASSGSSGRSEHRQEAHQP